MRFAPISDVFCITYIIIVVILVLVAFIEFGNSVGMLSVLIGGFSFLAGKIR